jgi:hypothetical protein
MKLIFGLLGAVGLLVAGGTIVLIIWAIKRKGYIRIEEPNGMIQNIELGAGVGMVLLGLVAAVMACKGR